MAPSNKDDPDGRVVEMDAMDEAEWERDQHTPVASDTAVEELRRQTVPTPPSASPVSDGKPVPTFARTTTRTTTIAAAPNQPTNASRPRSEPGWARAETKPASPQQLETPPAGVRVVATDASTAAKLQKVTTVKAKSGAATPAPAMTKKPTVSIPVKAVAAPTVAAPTNKPAAATPPPTPVAPAPAKAPTATVPARAPSPSAASSSTPGQPTPSTATPPARPTPSPSTTTPARPTPTPASAATSPSTSAPARPTPTPASAATSTPTPSPASTGASATSSAPSPTAASTSTVTPHTSTSFGGAPSTPSAASTSPATMTPGTSTSFGGAPSTSPSAASTSPEPTMLGASTSPAAAEPPSPAAPTVPVSRPVAKRPASSPSSRAASEITPLPPPPATILVAPPAYDAAPAPPRPVALASGSSALAGDIAATIGSRAAEPSQSSTIVTNAVTQSDGANVDAIAATAKRRPLPLFIGGGVVAALAIVVVLIAVLRGGGSDSAKRKRVSANDSPAKSGDVQLPETVDSRRAHDGFGSGSQMRIEEERARKAAAARAASGSNEATPTTTAAIDPPTETPPPTETAPPPITAPPPVPVKRTPTLGGKKVVLEYDNAAPKETPKKVPVPAKGDDTASIGAARITYFNGNRKLFAGDADSAIKLYKQALAVYPGYVASYRGLGLAYAQKNDKANALKAFRTYIAAVPGAKDIALVRKRIAQLQK